MKFAEMPYQRVDTEAVVAALKELTQELKAAKSGEEQFEIHQKFYALRDEYNTTIQIAMIRSDVDTADEFYSEEKNYYNEVLPTINNQETEYRKALYYSPYREVLEEKIGKVAFKSMELEFKAMDEKLIPLMQEENALTTQYDKLIASAKIDWEGEALNLSLLRPYMTHEDREIRRKAHEKYSAFFQSKAEELDEIYRSKYDYRKFLKQFCRLREEVELDTESFDYIFYSFGMEHYGNIPLIEPLEYKEVNRLEELVIAIDTSGSCSGETVQRFLGETYGILSEKENFFSRMKVYIVQCDCFIQKVDVIHSEEEWKEYIRNVKIQGRGGTDFRPVFELIRQEKERKELKNLRALIYFTDGDGIYPGQKPDYETAFVFLKRTDKMKLVPPWAKCLITGTGQTAEQMSV